MNAVPAQPDRTRPAVDAVAVVMVVGSIALAVVGLAFLPGILIPAAAVLSLAAVVASARWRLFATAAVAIAGLAWMAGMIIAVLTENPLF